MSNFIFSWPGCPVYNHLLEGGLRWFHSRSYDADTAPLMHGCVYPCMKIETQNGINLSGTFAVYYTGNGNSVPMTLAGEIRQWPIEWVVAEAMHANRAIAEAPAPRFLETVEGQAALAAACGMYAAARAENPQLEIALTWTSPGWRVIEVGAGNREQVQPYYVGQWNQQPRFSTTASPPLLWRPTVDPRCWWAK